MTEVEILRKLAESLDKSQQFKEKYDAAMREWNASRPFVHQRTPKQVLTQRAKLITPFYEKYKYYKKKAEGYLFMWTQKF